MSYVQERIYVIEKKCLGEYLGLTESNGRLQSVAQRGASKRLLSAKYY
jgi:hypothetical protein